MLMGNHKTPHISKTQKSAALDYTYDTKHGEDRKEIRILFLLQDIWSSTCSRDTTDKDKNKL